MEKGLVKEKGWLLGCLQNDPPPFPSSSISRIKHARKTISLTTQSGNPKNLVALLEIASDFNVPTVFWLVIGNSCIGT